MKENTIISLADANYFELLNELVDSINRFAQSKKLDICIMDAGLTDDQIHFLLNPNLKDIIIGFDMDSTLHQTAGFVRKPLKIFIKNIYKCGVIPIKMIQWSLPYMKLIKIDFI